MMVIVVQCLENAIHQVHHGPIRKKKKVFMLVHMRLVQIVFGLLMGVLVQLDMA